MQETHTGHRFGESLRSIGKAVKVPITFLILRLKPAAGPVVHRGRSCGFVSPLPTSSSALVFLLLKSCSIFSGGKQTLLSLQTNGPGFSAVASAVPYARIQPTHPA